MKKFSYLAISLALVSWCGFAVAGDAAAGKATFEAQCAECHFADDFAGDSAGDIAKLIDEVRSGAIEHEADAPKKMSAADAANIAAFWASQQ
jgi:mono/diheme cytochrome c family protein